MEEKGEGEEEGGGGEAMERPATFNAQRKGEAVMQRYWGSRTSVTGMIAPP